MIQLFCQTGGKSNDALSSLLAWTNKSYTFPDSHGVLGRFARTDVASIGSELRERGYHVFDQRLPASLCDQLLEFALTSAMHPRGKDDEAESQREIPVYPREHTDAVRYDFSESTLVNNALVLRVDGGQIDHFVAQEYLGSRPIVDVVAMWWNAASSRPDKQAAQYWHFDMDRIKWLKFFHLPDRRGTQQRPSLIHQRFASSRWHADHLLAKGYSRLTDEEVSQCYGTDKYVEFTAPRGR